MAITKEYAYNRFNNRLSDGITISHKSISATVSARYYKSSLVVNLLFNGNLRLWLHLGIKNYQPITKPWTNCVFCFGLLLFSLVVSGQSYRDSMKQYIGNYINTHEVVKGEDRKEMHFFDVNEKYRVVAKFEKEQTNQWFEMPTSGRIKKIFRVYGILSFTINDTLVKLNLYQSQGLMGSDQYKNYLFLPFTDATTGVETYESGRYIDLLTSDIMNNEVIIDFNKAYNPYCAYVTGVYNCPIPPAANHLPVAILAGEKVYGKH